MDMNSSKNIEFLMFLLNKKINKNIFECFICFENTETFYTFCKPNCMNYSYCKKCINHITKETKKCPFTNIEVDEKNICLDYRKNKKVEKQKSMQEEFEKMLNNKLINNISIRIDIN